MSKKRVDHIVGMQRDDLEHKYNMKVDLMNEENKMLRQEMERLKAELQKKQQTQCTEDMLSDQLKEMTDVLEEFDNKYS